MTMISSKLKIQLIVGGAVAVLVASTVSINLDVEPLAGVLGGLLIVCLSIAPILPHARQDTESIPFLPMIGAYYFIFYGLPIFATPLAYLQDGRVVLYERVVLGPLGWGVTLLVSAGVLSLFVGFRVSRISLTDKMPRLRFAIPEPRPETLNLCYWILFAASVLYRWIPPLAAIPSVGQFLGPASLLALGGFFLQWRDGHLPRWQAFAILLICIPLELYFRLRFLFVTDFLFLCVFLILVFWRCGLYRVIAASLVVAVLAVFSYSATTAYRAKADTFVGKLAVTYTGFQRMWRMESTPRETVHVGTVSYIPGISPLINRIGHIWTFQTVYERTPEPIPYWEGETYRPLLTAAIPRMFYPDKPQELAGAVFGLRYGFTETELDATSFNIPWIVELLANFGPFGVITGMGLFGLFLGFLNHVFNSRAASNLEFVIGLTVIFRLFYQESNFSVMVGSLPILVLSLYAYFRFGPVLIDRLAMRFAPRGTN